ncbi:MipA/OmpV family protein [Marinomonas sp. S3726]|uniref:MipA/OmpV family protein n=1 Tax=Marinomonas sp. S3726 TaxID=579484 RepID=UPI000AE35BE9|nr:MipA/OmpV family protein [Marinomonas sp. S3726]
MANYIQALSLTGVLVLSAGNTLANEYTEKEAFEWETSIGLGYFVSQTPYIGSQQESEITPYLSISWGPLFFDGESLGAYLYGEDSWGISASISSDSLGDSDRGDSKALADMTKLSDVVVMNLTFEQEASWGAIEATLTTDVSSKHKGNLASLSYSYPLYLKDWSLMPLVSAQWFDKKSAAYYYGVKAEDVTASRALYTPDSGINYAAGINAEYELNSHNSIGLSLITTFYSDEIKQSSIADKSHNTSFGLLYSYMF